MGRIIAYFSLILYIANPLVAFASDKEIIRKIENLRIEINELKNQVDRIYLLLEERSLERQESAAQWGCHVEAFGHFYYGTGISRAEAAGKALSRCSEKENHCSEINLKCSSG